jgi:hypothetical protein
MNLLQRLKNNFFPRRPDKSRIKWPNDFVMTTSRPSEWCRLLTQPCLAIFWKDTTPTVYLPLEFVESEETEENEGDDKQRPPKLLCITLSAKGDVDPPVLFQYTLDNETLKPDEVATTTRNGLQGVRRSNRYQFGVQGTGQNETKKTVQPTIPCPEDWAPTLCEQPLAALEFYERLLGAFPHGQRDVGSKEDQLINWCLAMTTAKENDRGESKLSVPCKIIDPVAS